MQQEKLLLVYKTEDNKCRDNMKCLYCIYANQQTEEIEDGFVFCTIRGTRKTSTCICNEILETSKGSFFLFSPFTDKKLTLKQLSFIA